MSAIGFFDEIASLVMRAEFADGATRAVMLAEVDCRLANAQRDGSLPGDELEAMRREIARMAQVQP